MVHQIRYKHSPYHPMFDYNLFLSFHNINTEIFLTSYHDLFRISLLRVLKGKPSLRRRRSPKKRKRGRRMKTSPEDLPEDLLPRELSVQQTILENCSFSSSGKAQMRLILFLPRKQTLKFPKL